MRTSAPGNSSGKRLGNSLGNGPGGGRGFTLLELLVVVAIIAIASAGVGFALRDGGHAQLRREAERLAALFESARAQSRASGVPVRWRVQGDGFRFEGLPAAALPEHWLSAGVTVAPGSVIELGPEPLLAPQALVLRSTHVPGQALRVVTDGARPFSVQPVDAAAP